MLTLSELHRANRLLGRAIVGHRLQTVVQSDDTSVVLGTYGDGTRRFWLLCARPASGRIGEVEKPAKALATPPALTQYLRAHALGGTVQDVRIVDDDRQLAFEIATKQSSIEILLSLFGARSNVYVLDGDRRIVAALRPLADTRSELVLGGAFASPSGRPPREGEDRFEATEDAEFFTAIEARYATAESEAGSDALRRRVERVLEKQRKLLDRKLAKLDGDMAAATRAVDCERQGELLKGVLSQVKKGDTEVVVRDPSAGEDVTIALDATRTPPENMELLFKRYRKALRTLTKGGAQQVAVSADRDAVGAEQEAFQELATSSAGGSESGDGDDAAFATFADRPLTAKLLGKFAPPTRGKGTGRKPGAPAPDRMIGKLRVPARLMPRRYPTAGGLEVWVGRSDAANDFLSTRIARGKDLFFHLDGAPGSHVILRTQGRNDPPSEAVLDACELAVHFSKAKKASRADVHVVPIKNLKKPKGAKPGLVMVHGGKSIHLRRIPARLERLLASKLDD